MRNEYDIEDLNPRKNPYAGRLKKQVTMNIDSATVDYFKSLAESEGIPVRRSSISICATAPSISGRSKCPGSELSLRV